MFKFTQKIMIINFTLMLSFIGHAQTIYELKDKEIENLTGTYSHLDIVNYLDKSTFVPMKSRVITYGITEIYQKNNQLIWKDTFCHCDFETNLPFHSKIDDSFTRAITPRSTPVEVTKLNNTIKIFRPETPTGIGIKLYNEYDELPSDPNDPRIFDQDNDGKPGVTSSITAFGGLKAEIYLARLERFSYDMTHKNNGQIQGVVKDRSQQLVVGATMKLLNRQSDPKQVENLNLSPIVLTPISQSIDCDGLMEKKDIYFPNLPRRNW